MKKQILDDDYTKIIKVIQSSHTKEHFDQCKQLIKLFVKKWEMHNPDIVILCLNKSLKIAMSKLNIT